MPPSLIVITGQMCEHSVLEIPNCIVQQESLAKKRFGELTLLEHWAKESLAN